ncbi:hypothetical protein Hanom_Chr05g00468891 [Helianthus anomalus]
MFFFAFRFCGPAIHVLMFIVSILLFFRVFGLWSSLLFFRCTFTSTFLLLQKCHVSKSKFFSR